MLFEENHLLGYIYELAAAASCQGRVFLWPFGARILQTEASDFSIGPVNSCPDKSGGLVFLCSNVDFQSDKYNSVDYRRLPTIPIIYKLWDQSSLSAFSNLNSSIINLHRHFFFSLQFWSCTQNSGPVNILSYKPCSLVFFSPQILALSSCWNDGISTIYLPLGTVPSALKK